MDGTRSGGGSWDLGWVRGNGSCGNVNVGIAGCWEWRQRYAKAAFAFRFCGIGVEMKKRGDHEGGVRTEAIDGIWVCFVDAPFLAYIHSSSSLALLFFFFLWLGWMEGGMVCGVMARLYCAVDGS